VAEVTHSREDHRQSSLVGRSNHVVVANGAARLDDRRCASLNRGKQTIREWEEGVRSDG
jgi:hypothetical protein